MAELPTPEALAALSEDDILCNIEFTKRRIAELSSLLDAYLNDLGRRVDVGELDSAFSYNDWSFTLSAGKRSWDYPAGVKALDSQLKAAKKASEADGSAISTLGAPFWIIRAPRP